MSTAENCFDRFITGACECFKDCNFAERPTLELIVPLLVATTRRLPREPR